MPILLLRPYPFYPRGEWIPKETINRGALADEALKKLRKRKKEPEIKEPELDDELLLMALMDDDF